MPLKQLFEIHSKLSGDLSFMLVASRNYKKKKGKETRKKKNKKQPTLRVDISLVPTNILYKLIKQI